MCVKKKCVSYELSKSYHQTLCLKSGTGWTDRKTPCKISRGRYWSQVTSIPKLGIDELLLLIKVADGLLSYLLGVGASIINVGEIATIRESSYRESISDAVIVPDCLVSIVRSGKLSKIGGSND